MDTTVAITRTGIFIAVYSLVLGIPFAIALSWQEKLVTLLGTNWWIVPLISSTILATAGPFLYLYIQKRAEDRLFQEQRRYQATLRQASMGMGRIKDLKKLLQLIVHIVTRTVRLEHSSIYINDAQSQKFILGAARSRANNFFPKEIISQTSSMIEHLMSTKLPIVYDEIKQRSQDYADARLTSIEAELKELDAALVIPSFIEDRLFAVIVLGKKVSNQMYSNDDLTVFSILASQVALAIENAQFFENIQKTQEQLFKAEKMATIGTMADGLSHQINNRLHAMGFIAGDALDTVKLKKDMPMSPELKEVMADLEHALARIQDNVAQGGDIVQGLLKYTRKGEEGFAEVSFDDLFNASLEMTQFKIKKGEMEVVRDYPSDLPKIRGNFTQLQEVFFNLIDNAYDAMMQRRHELREPEYKPTIKVSAHKSQDSRIEITIEDNGSGIKEEDKNKLFTPFFTTKLSSRKGTGLGLYVIRKLVEENHGGKVFYDSVHNRGTRVRLELPSV